MNILIALIPALGWGLFPLVQSKVGGRPSNQILGTGIGATIFAIIVYFITSPKLDATSFTYAFLAGALWNVAQVGQFTSMRPERMGVTATMPISSGFQIIGNSLIGVLILGDWPKPMDKLIGLLAMVLIIIGVALTAVTDDNKNQSSSTKDILFLLCTTIGYWIFSSFPNLPAIKNVEANSLFLPEVLGILFGSIIYCLLSRDTLAFRQKETWSGVFGGILWGIASIAYIYSAKLNSTSTAFLYSQLNVLISTLGGMLFLHERKNKRELKYTLFGLLFLVIGVFVIGFIK